MQFNIPTELKNASGVYIIRNSVNSKVYVGSAVHFWKRFKAHKSGLNTQKHRNGRLQNFVRKYGIASLTFDLLELTTSDTTELASAEQHHLASFDAANPKKGFNIIVEVFPSVRHSDETRKILSMQRKGIKRAPLTDEHKKRLSIAAKGRRLSSEHRQKLAEARRNRAPTSEETRKRLSEGHKGIIPSNDARKKMSLAQKGRKHSDESKKIMSAQRKGRIVSEETRKKLSDANKGRTLSEENKQKLLAANRGRKLSEEHKQKLLVARWPHKALAPQSQLALF